MATEGREISINLKNVKKFMKFSNKKLAKFINEEPEVVKALEKEDNTEIPISVLYQLYWFANRNWLDSIEAKGGTKVEYVMCWRGLRDSCDEEIARRLKV